MAYLSLEPDLLAEATRKIYRRVEERFPDSGLREVCAELVELAEKARDTTDRLTRPMLALRIGTALLVLVILVGIVVAVTTFSVPEEGFTFPDLVQTVEAGINDIVLIGLGVFFLITLERRIKRRRILAALAELRSIAHLIDMHQLTKDPQYVLRTIDSTPASPVREFDRNALSRYLDYCTEMLSMTGKIAAVYVQKYDDGIALTAVNEIETLTNGLSRKVWQKLMMLETGAPNASVGIGTPAI